MFLLDMKDTAPYMVSSDYKERFIAEYTQLAIRIVKLSRLVSAYDRKELYFEPSTPIEILKAQLNTMNDYIEILQKRADIEKIDLPEVSV